MATGSTCAATGSGPSGGRSTGNCGGSGRSTQTSGCSVDSPHRASGRDGFPRAHPPWGEPLGRGVEEPCRSRFFTRSKTALTDRTHRSALGEQTRRQGFSLASQPYWTDADQAELDVLTWTLVQAMDRHERLCRLWAAEVAEYGIGWCPHLSEALGLVLEWRAGRILKSKAAWLRRREDDRAEAAQQTRGRVA